LHGIVRISRFSPERPKTAILTPKKSLLGGSFWGTPPRFGFKSALKSPVQTGEGSQKSDFGGGGSPNMGQKTQTRFTNRRVQTSYHFRSHVFEPFFSLFDVFDVWQIWALQPKSEKSTLPRLMIPYQTGKDGNRVFQGLKIPNPGNHDFDRFGQKCLREAL
jgi:hypothetical protein